MARMSLEVLGWSEIAYTDLDSRNDPLRGPERGDLRSGRPCRTPGHTFSRRDRNPDGPASDSSPGQPEALEPLGWTGAAAEWLTLVCLHSGVFTRAQAPTLRTA